MVAIGWWPTDPADAESRRRTMASMLLGIERELASDRANVRVILEGGSDKLELSFEELQHFLDGYYLPFVDYRFSVSSKANQVTVSIEPSTDHSLEMRRLL